MNARNVRTRPAAVAIGVVGAVALSATGALAGQTGPQADSQGRYVPDLVEILPGKLDVHTRGHGSGKHTFLSFAAAAENYGDGPLIIRGSRPSRAYATMTATQIVRRSDGSTLKVPNVGTLRYIPGGGHNHWHLVGFMRFDVRTVSNHSLGRRDRKQGFCLGDRYSAKGWPGKPGSPQFTSHCGINRPGLLHVKEGISLGYGDVYGPDLEGQDIDITGLPSGRYVLVQRVDPNHRLLDLHSDNNVSSILFKLTRGPHRRARILSWCTSTDRCTKPGQH